MFKKIITVVVAVVAIGLSEAAAEPDSFSGYAGGFRSSSIVGAYALGFTVYPFGYNNFYGYPGNYDEGVYKSCYVARQRVKAKHGWRVRSVDVCE